MMALSSTTLRRRIVLTVSKPSLSFSTTTTRQVHGQRKMTGDKDFKTYKPITPGIRQLRLPRNDHLWKGRAHLPLTVPKRKTGGRNNAGRITSRHIGGGHKQRIRKLDFFRRDPGIQSVQRIEYDPTRSAHIALLKHKESGTLTYILAPEGLRAGDQVESFRAGVPIGLANSELLEEPTQGNESPEVTSNSTTGVTLQSAKDAASSTLELGFLRQLTIKPGNHVPIRLIPPGVGIHAISLAPNAKAQLVRAAGTSAKVVSLGARGGDYATIRLASGEIRYVHMDASATIGTVSNRHWQGRVLGKAGRSRWLGRRPRVRGVAMNRRDHPLGGGRGKSKSNKQAVSRNGKLAKGGKTRRPGLRGNRMVVTPRSFGPHVGARN